MHGFPAPVLHSRMGEKAAFGDLVLVLGDAHIPYRTDDIPEQFKSLLVPNKMQHVLCTGNMCSDQIRDYLRTLAPNVHIAKGDFDEQDLPEREVVRIGKFSIGIVHGHQVIPWGETESLLNLQREIDVDILITGHTHITSVQQHGSRFLINPGSITGAFSSTTKDVIPGFILMAIQGEKLVTFVYQLKEGKVVVTKSEFVKES